MFRASVPSCLEVRALLLQASRQCFADLGGSGCTAAKKFEEWLGDCDCDSDRATGSIFFKDRNSDLTWASLNGDSTLATCFSQVCWNKRWASPDVSLSLTPPKETCNNLATIFDLLTHILFYSTASL